MAWHWPIARRNGRASHLPERLHRKPPIVLRPVTRAELRRLEEDASARCARRVDFAVAALIASLAGGVFVVAAWALLKLTGGGL